MAEQSPVDRQQQFDILLPIAETGAGETWIRDNKGDYEIWRLAYTEQITMHSVNRSYWHWQTSAPDHIERQTYRNIHVSWEPTALGHEKRTWARHHDGARFNLPHLVSLFVKQAIDADEFAHYTLPFITHTAQNKDVTRFGNVPNDLIAKSLVLPENPFLIPDSPLIEGLRSMGPDDTRLAGVIADRIGRFLTGNLVHRTAGTVSADPKHEQTLLEMLGALDEHQLVSPDFWYGYGIQTGLVFRYPQLLEPTVSRLSTPEGTQALRKIKIPQPLTVITGYVNNLLAHYAKDKFRDQEKIREAMKIIDTPLGGTILGRLISIGQGVTLAMNRDLKTKYNADEDVLLSSLDPTQTVQAGEALFRILETIRLPGLASGGR